MTTNPKLQEIGEHSRLTADKILGAVGHFLEQSNAQGTADVRDGITLLKECTEIIKQALTEYSAELEKERDSALIREKVLRQALMSVCSYLITINDDMAVGFSAPMPTHVLEQAENALCPK